MEVEIWSDVVCPWCYIGKRRFEAALGRFEHRDEVHVTYRSFELDPAAPRVSAGSLSDHLAAKFGVEPDAVAAMNDRVTGIARDEGLDYRLDIARPANSFDAHRILALARSHGLQEPMKERLLSAYFTEGRVIADHDTLTQLATEVGLQKDQVTAVLEGDQYEPEVRADEQVARELGITGVPCFVVDRRVAVAGADSADRLLALLEDGWAAQERLDPGPVPTA